MIRYALRCSNDHSFESWFASASSFDVLKAGGHLACAVCGVATVEKALMAPTVQTAEPPQVRSAPQTPSEEALAELRRRIETESDYVGLSFAAEARAMHEGQIPERPIYGEARPEDAKALLADGIPVAPLPFVPRRHTN